MRPGLSRRAALVGLLAACRFPWSSPEEASPSLEGLRPEDAGRWLAEVRKAGASGPEVLSRALASALGHCVETLDLHPLLIFGPAWRTAPEDDRLLLWVLLHITDWWEFSGCTERVPPAPVTARAEGLLPRDSNAHPGILVSEATALERVLPVNVAADLVARADRIARSGPARADLVAATRSTAAALAASEPRDVSPQDVARWVLTHGASVFDTLRAERPDLPVLWNGLWLAAASAWLGYGGPLNPTHTITSLDAAQQIAGALGGPEAWLAATSAAARLAVDTGPVPPFEVLVQGWADVEPAPRAAWLARARSPGPDFHDLKFSAAVARAPEGVFAVVSGLAKRSGRLEPSPWSALDEAWDRFARHGGPRRREARR